MREEKESTAQLPKMCSVCEFPNAFDSKMCSKCGKPLDLAVALEIEEQQKTEKLEREKRLSEVEAASKELLERIESLEIIKKEIQLIHLKINETKNIESDPSNPDFPDGGPFDTRLVNLEVREINENSMLIYDSEFEESTDVILRGRKVFCTLDKSTTCKHVLFALANPEFYGIVKKNNISIIF
ncbi:MAG: hypothetical protein ACRDFB_08840 [Rhabdochlamydiaceae bacterium]